MPAALSLDAGRVLLFDEHAHQWASVKNTQAPAAKSAFQVAIGGKAYIGLGRRNGRL